MIQNHVKTMKCESPAYINWIDLHGLKQIKQTKRCHDFLFQVFTFLIIFNILQYEEQTVGYKTNLYEGLHPWATTFRLTTTS